MSGREDGPGRGFQAGEVGGHGLRVAVGAGTVGTCDEDEQGLVGHGG
jgi:hypothetical protein